MADHIHPIFDRLLTRDDYEQRLGQRGKVLWLTGLSGSGKSTLAIQLERKLFEAGFFSKVLDGDNIRTGINNNLGFSEAERMENIRRISEVARLFLDTGIICINAFISPKRAMRDMARSIVGPGDFIEIYVNAPLDICESRDVKGLYQKARQGMIKGFTGIDDPYEPPFAPDLEIRTDLVELEDGVDQIFAYLRPLIALA
ncbi:MAG: adenylyl-sulfate kinase [Haliscomenobacter sp.]|nr:adenylyl-sulfate kinase [Haliscomenobacter sp.]MBP9076859.1 adenylyl-sulfate kinase [Haliscomenobacter sp.]